MKLTESGNFHLFAGNGKLPFVCCKWKWKTSLFSLVCNRYMVIDDYPCAHLWKLNVGTFQKYGKNFHCVIWSKELFTSCANAAIVYYQVLSDKNNVGQNNYITCGKIGQHKYLHVLHKYARICLFCCGKLHKGEILHFVVELLTYP